MLQKIFVRLKDDVFEFVKSKPVDTFKVRLISMNVNEEVNHAPFLKKIADKNETILGIWMDLSHYLNFLNYEILQHILTKFEDEALQERMTDYTEKIKVFFKTTRVRDFHKCWPVYGKAPPEEKLRNLTLKTNKDWNTCTLEELDEHRHYLAQQLYVPAFALHPEDVGPGCLSITYSLHPSMVPQLTSDIRNTELKVFVNMDIETIIVDGIVCYQSPLVQYTNQLKQLYTSKSPLQPLSDFADKDLLPFRLAKIQKQILSQEGMDKSTRESLRGDMDDVVFKKTEMKVSELGIVPDGSQPQVVLIEGAPGVGKTTFAWDQCRQWAEGKLLQAYSTVILLPLRDNNIRHISSLPGLFKHSKAIIRDEVAKEIAERNGKGCLIWLEAWDELGNDMRSHSIFTHLIQGIQLSAATIYITSRPWATRSLLEQMGDRISQHTELLALAKEQVDNHKKQISAEQALSLTNIPKRPRVSNFEFPQYIEDNPIINAAMYTPVSADIVKQVFKSVPENPPTTFTGLYSAYIYMRLQQYLTKHLEMNIKVTKLADLPKSVLLDFQKLCAMAYKGVLQHKIVFSNLPENVPALNLLQEVPQVYDEGEAKVSYNFLHYTVQEYLAALHLSDLSIQNQIDIIKSRQFKKVTTEYGSSYYEATQFKMVFKFLAGITKFALYPIDVLSSMLSHDAPTICSWLFESQNIPLLSNVLGSSEKKISMSYTATNTDYFAIGYSIVYSNCLWKTTFSCVNDIAIEFFSKGCRHQLPESGIFSRLYFVSFTEGSMSAEGVQYFLNIPKPLLKSVEHLNLRDNKLDLQACNLLAEGTLLMPCLQHLNLSSNMSIGSSGAVKLLSSLKNTQIRQLIISKTGVSDPDFKSLASYIESTTTLQELSIGFNNVSVESIELICKALHSNSSIKSLDMRGCVLTPPHCTHLGQLLKNPIKCEIEELNLSHCSLTGDGVGELVSGLGDNHTLRDLDLVGNPITSEGAAAVATMLKTNSSLDTLWLEECSIGSDGGVELGAALEKNNTLKILWLSGNSLGDDGARGLSIGLANNSSLIRLYLRGDGSLGVEGVSLLLECLEENNTTLLRLGLPKKYKRYRSSFGSKCEVIWW